MINVSPGATRITWRRWSNTPGEVQCGAHWVRLDWAKWKVASSQAVAQGYEERRGERFEFSLKQSPSSELKPDSNPYSSRLGYLSWVIIFWPRMQNHWNNVLSRLLFKDNMKSSHLITLGMPDHSVPIPTRSVKLMSHISGVPSWGFAVLVWLVNLFSLIADQYFHTLLVLYTLIDVQGFFTGHWVSFKRRILKTGFCAFPWTTSFMT